MLSGNEKVPFKSRFGEQKFLESAKCGGKTTNNGLFKERIQDRKET